MNRRFHQWDRPENSVVLVCRKCGMRRLYLSDGGPKGGQTFEYRMVHRLILTSFQYVPPCVDTVISEEDRA